MSPNPDGLTDRTSEASPKPPPSAEMAPLPQSSKAVGPYMLQDLVDDLPLDSPEAEGVTITYLEAWSQNLYVGTSAHEILHLVSIPATPNPGSTEPTKPLYILASRLQAPTATGTFKAPYIKQILVLPTTSRALVLSSTGHLSFYTLPEFSPASTKLKDVNYIGGLDLNEEDSEETGRKLVMVLAKTKIRNIKVGEDARLVRDIPLAGALRVMRRGTIACFATQEKYGLLDTENFQQMPLFPLTTSSGEDPVPLTPAFVEDVVHPPSSSAAPTPPPPSARPSSSHPPRISSLTTGRERRNSSANTTKGNLVAPAGHSRSASAGGTSATARPGSRLAPPAASTSRPSSRTSQLSGQEGGSPRVGSPTSSTGSGSPKSASPTGKRSPAPPGSPKLRPSSIPTLAPPTPKRPKSVTPPPPPPPPAKLQPHIASPTPNEFLLTTGTSPDDPGVGLFVDMNGDVTRGTIQFEKYPDQVIIQDKWVISVIPEIGLDLQKWDLDDENKLGVSEKKGSIAFDSKIKLKEVLGLDGTMVPAIGRKLRLVHVPLLHTNELGNDDFPGEERKNEEERIVAQRISTVESSIVVYEGRKVWSLLPSPLVLRLDSRLPNFSDENFDGIVARVRGVLNVLDEVNRIEPTTERTFHEVSFIKQKCGLLVLGELLRISARQTSDIGPKEIIRVEEALLESPLDPRFIVALFGHSFVADIAESATGVWVYAGIREVYRDLKMSDEVGTGFTRDALMLLKRYLVGCRSKRGFGSVGDDKEVFQTVDSALLRVMLMLDSPEYLVQKGKTVVQEGNIRNELYRLVESLDNLTSATAIIESFNRLYVLSILYSANKKSREVLQTWRRILESSDPTHEFADGENKLKSYLLRLKDPSLVEEFGAYLCSRNPALGISLFTDPKSRVQLSPEQIIPILRTHAPAALRPYIEHLVTQTKNPAYANELISLYLDSLIAVLSTDPSASDRLQTSYIAYRAILPPKPTYREFLADNSTQDADSWWHDRLRLLDLLGGDTAYNVPTVFTKVKEFAHVLVPEMVLLHGRSTEHQPALSLLTHELADFDTAINYCLFGGLSLFQTHNVITRREEQEMLFNLLLDEFLKLEDVSVRIVQTKGLLEKFGRWLDVVHVLEVVPEEWSVGILSGFLLGALRRLVRESAEVKVQRSLERTVGFGKVVELVERCDELGPTVEQA